MYWHDIGVAKRNECLSLIRQACQETRFGALQIGMKNLNGNITVK
jgi:hypothetical protein